MDALILWIFLILIKFPMIQQNSYIRMRMLVNTGLGLLLWFVFISFCHATVWIATSRLNEWGLIKTSPCTTYVIEKNTSLPLHLFYWQLPLPLATQGLPGILWQVIEGYKIMSGYWAVTVSTKMPIWRQVSPIPT